MSQLSKRGLAEHRDVTQRVDVAEFAGLKTASAVTYGSSHKEVSLFDTLARQVSAKVRLLLLEINTLQLPESRSVQLLTSSESGTCELVERQLVGKIVNAFSISDGRPDPLEQSRARPSPSSRLPSTASGALVATSFAAGTAEGTSLLSKS